jgi:hypothetical protein
LKIFKDAKKLQKDMRSKAMKDEIIREYKKFINDYKKKQTINTSSLVDESTKIEDDE